MIGREQILAMIPHAGEMCLLDRVVEWDQASIRCASSRHAAEDNPLRRAGALAMVCGVEFAAQAMAVHAALLAEGAAGKPRAGYLASLRDITWQQGRLDLIADELTVTAQRLMGDEQTALYRFALAAAGREVLSGRATVVLDAAA